MSRRSTLVEDVLRAPWWISLILLILGNFFINRVLPMWFGGDRANGPIGALMPGAINQAIPMLSTMVSLVFGFTLLITGTRDLFRWLRNKKRSPEANESIINEIKQAATEKLQQKQEIKKEETKPCPKCNNNMNIKTKRSGEDEGLKFWVCSKFPECKTYVPCEEENWF